jgi:single-strand DNA-binding protein
MINNLTLSGNLGHDPETRHFGEKGEQLVTTFSLAFRASKQRTGWLRVVCFDRLAEVAEQHLHRGARVVVMGVLDQPEWEGPDGQKRNGFQVIARSLEFIRTEGPGAAWAAPDKDVPF